MTDIDISPEAVEMWTTTHGLSPAMRDNVQALSVALTQCQHELECQKLTTEMANTAWDQTFNALTQARAETAAAFERAAEICSNVAKEREEQIRIGKSVPAHAVNVPQQMRWSAGKLQAEQLAEAIRALSTPDQTAARDRMIADAEALGMRKAAEIAKLIAGDACDTPDEIRGAAMVEYAILAAIPEGGDA